MKKILIFAIFLMPIVAHSQPASMYGISIGQRIELPMCAVDNPLNTMESCLVKPHNSGVGFYYLYFPKDQRLQHAMNNHLTVTISDATQRVLSMSVFTYPPDQESAMETLIKKFGPPITYAYKQDNIIAFWQLKNGVIIRFYGGGLVDYKNIPSGRLQIGSKEYNEQTKSFARDGVPM